MLEELTNPILELISSSIQYEVGSTEYYIVLGVSVAAWLVVARVLMGLFRSDRGIFGALLALAFPLVLGLLAYGLVVSEVSPQIEAEWARSYLPLGALALVAILVIFIVSRRFMQLSGVTTLIIFIFASAVAVGAFMAAVVTLDTLENGEDQIKQREEHNKQEIDSLL